MSNEIRIKAAEMALDLTKALMADKNAGLLLTLMRTCAQEAGRKDGGDVVLAHSHLYHHFLKLLSGPEKTSSGMNPDAGNQG